MDMGRVQGKQWTQKVSKAKELYKGVRLKKSDVSDGSEQATSPRSTAKGKQPSVGINGRDTEMIEMGAGLASAAPKSYRKKGPNGDQSVKPPTSEEVDNQLDYTKSVLFLSIDVVTNDSRACSVDVGINDLKTMASLRESYHALRSSFLWNRKRAVGIKFYRVSQISTTTFDLMLTPRSSEAFSTNQNVATTYSYTETKNDIPLSMTRITTGNLGTNGRRAIHIPTARHGTSSATRASAVVLRR
jgi:hypothetical protein